jgi:hypothetical protein
LIIWSLRYKCYLPNILHNVIITLHLLTRFTYLGVYKMVIQSFNLSILFCLMPFFPHRGTTVIMLKIIPNRKKNHCLFRVIEMLTEDMIWHRKLLYCVLRFLHCWLDFLRLKLFGFLIFWLWALLKYSKNISIGQYSN